MALSNHHKVASCAWTGMAGPLLRFGSTLHSLCKLPVPINENSNIKPNSEAAKKLRDLSILFIDKASMIPLDASRAIDLLFQDIVSTRDSPTTFPFGGKLTVLAGDFRQIFPIVPRARPSAILENCINRSVVWKHFIKFQLTTNMRANEGEQQFCDWLLELGNDTLQSTHPNATPGQTYIPQQCNITTNIVNSIFPNFSPLSDRSQDVILTPINDDTHVINSQVLAVLRPEELLIVYPSVDEIMEDEGNEVTNIATEFLHSITPSGLPKHLLELKVGCNVILLRNLDKKAGLANGTRLKIIHLGTRIIEAVIISGSSIFVGNHVYFSKIKLCPSDSNVPFKFQRFQFPIKLAYCMTINKAQGQTFNRLGLYLPNPVFAHGQLYVAFSRATSFDHIYVQMKNGPNQCIECT